MSSSEEERLPESDGESDPETTELTGKDAWLALGVCPEIAATCETMKWMKPTGIQKKSIPIALKGQDIIGLAETGSGKTAAFAIPVLQVTI